VVVLSYNNNTKTQKIFIRQGEGDDYAPGQSSGATWSVFNVSTVGNVVQYPTQAGYFYQWHYDLVINTPKPIHPINPLGAVAGWGTVNVANLYALAGACPAGYAVPTGTVGSQAYQLVANTKTVVGYYADGWFDRRALNSTALVGLVNIAVSVDPSVPTNPRNTDVAYIGALLFNETTNKSLFWPRSGMRRDIDGVLMSPGGFTSYWTSARQMGVGGVDIQVLLSSSQSVDIDGTSPGVNNGGMVRCVRTGAPLDLVDGVSSNPWGTPDADGTDKWVNW